MDRRLGVYAFLIVACCPAAVSQTFPSDDPVIRKIWTEAMDSTQLPTLAPGQGAEAGRRRTQQMTTDETHNDTKSDIP